MIFAVQDSGIGIPQGDMTRLFEKFYRGTNREALAQRGSGLGLPSSNPLQSATAEESGWKVNSAREASFFCRSLLCNRKRHPLRNPEKEAYNRPRA